MPASPAPARPSSVSTSRQAEAFPLRAFFGHHKCATGWIDGILMEISFHLGRHFRIVHTARHFAPHASLAELVQREDVDLLAYTNATRQHAQTLPLYRGFHVVRDPRDVVVSAYFSHLYSHGTEDWPELEAHRAELQRLDKAEGLLCEMAFSAHEFADMADWDYEQEHVLEVKMEDLTARPLEGFIEIVRFLELADDDALESWPGRARRARLRMNRLNHKGRRFMPGRLPLFPVPRRPQTTLPVAVVEEIVRAKSFKRLAGGRRRGQENVQSHYRKGVPGDWRNHFGPQHIRAFKDRFNDLLLQLGYETDPDW